MIGGLQMSFAEVLNSPILPVSPELRSSLNGSLESPRAKTVWKGLLGLSIAGIRHLLKFFSKKKHSGFAPVLWSRFGRS